MTRYAFLLWLGSVWAAWIPTWAAGPRLDVFPGYSGAGYARLGSHYPLALELQGEGTTIRGHVEVASSSSGGVLLRYPVELPSGTLKRWVLPLFAASPNATTLDVRLVTDAGKVVAERKGAGVVTLAPEAVIVGTLPSQVQGAPSFPEISRDRNPGDLRPLMARLDAGLFPDNPLALEGLNAVCLDSRRALDLKEPQYLALLAWVASGGHVVVGVGSPADILATPWLREFVPARVGGTVTVPWSADFQRFLAATNGPGQGEWMYGTQPAGLHLKRAGTAGASPYGMLSPDTGVDRLSLPAVALSPAPGAHVFLGTPQAPLGVVGRYGRGLVTVLAFNPEQEPFRSWKNRPWFFARLVSVPDELLGEDRLNLWGGRGIDTVFGAMIETRQIRKLPVGVLLVLLLVYLAVIGPFDQWWLRKINRPMLTWITFPSYVALFSLLIYFIGFKLRSGQAEYSELQVVDVLPRGDSGDVALRGRSFASLYSPANNTYRLQGEFPSASLRGEFRSGHGMANSVGRLEVMLDAKGFTAGAYVPVWTAQGFVGDWFLDAPAPLAARWSEGRLVVHAGNRRLEKVLVVHGGQLHDLGPVGPGGDLYFTERPGEPLEMGRWGPRFTAVAARRENTFGDSTEERIDPPDWPAAIVAASFASRLAVHDADNQRDWMWSNGFDLTPNQLRGDTILFGWMPADTAVPRMNASAVARGSRSAMFRLVIPRSPETP